MSGQYGWCWMVAASKAAVTEAISLARVPGWTGTAAALRELSLPPEAEFDRLDAFRVAAVAGTAAARQHRARLAAEDGSARTALAALRGHDLPDVASVAAARAERDRGMRLVLARAYGSPAPDAEEAAFAGEEAMPPAYECRVRAADALADRRTDELKRVQEAEQLIRVIDGLAVPMRQAASDEADATGGQATAEQAWARAVAPLGLGPATTLGELRQACAARDAVVDALVRFETASLAEGTLTRRHAA